MRQIYTSPRHENVDRVVELLNSHGIATSITTGSIMNTFSSPGSGYFQASSTGWPTLVCTVYISPTPRWFCC